MAVVYVDLVNGIDWYTQAVYDVATTYAADALVIPSAASGLTSVTARVWKSLQNGNVGNALEEGSWWTLVADGSAAKPFKTIDDSTRGLTGGDEWRCAKSPAHTQLTGVWTAVDDSVTTNKGKLVCTSDNNDRRGDFSTGNYYGNDIIGWHLWSYGAWSAGNPTIITFIKNIQTETGASVTDQTIYQASVITLSSVQTVRSSGVSAISRIKGSGGWNLSGTPVRDGYTCISMPSGSLLALSDYSELSYFCNISTATLVATGDKLWCYIHHCVTSRGQLMGASGNNCLVEDCWSNSADAVYSGNNSRHNVVFRRCKILGLSIFSISVSDQGGTVLLDDCIIGSIASARIAQYGAGLYVKSVNCTYIGITTILRGFTSNTGEIRCVGLYKNCNLINSTAVTNAYDARLHFQTYNQVSTDHRQYTPWGNIFSDTTTRHTSSGLAWRFEPNANATTTYLLELLDVEDNDPFEVAVAANSQVTATIWCKKSDANTAFEAQFICKGGQLAGIASDVTAVATDSTDWQQLTIQVTPTEAGVLRFGFQVWGSSTATCHIDDFGVTQ